MADPEQKNPAITLGNELKTHWLHLDGKPSIENEQVAQFIAESIDVQDPAIAKMLPQLLPVAAQVVDLTYEAPGYKKDFDAALTLKNNQEKIAKLREQIAALETENRTIESGQGTWLGFAAAIAQQLANTIPGKIVLKSAITPVTAKPGGSTGKTFAQFAGDRANPDTTNESHPITYAVEIDGTKLYLKGPYELAQAKPIREHFGTQATQLRDLWLEVGLKATPKDGDTVQINGHAVKLIGR